jgi:hypothetical protein
MKLKVASLAAAGAVIGFLSFGGITLASAQDSSTTTTAPSATTAPSTTADPNCPDKGDSGAAATPDPAASSGTTPGT